MTAKTKTCRFISPKELIKDFSVNFLDESLCVSYLLQKLHPSGLRCSHCAKAITDKTTLNNFSALKRCQCKSCKRWFTAMTGTFLQGSHLAVREIILFMLLFGFQVSSNDIARTLSLHPDTVKLWQKKIEALKERYV